MKILNRQQIKEWDQYTIRKKPISSHELMEKAGAKCVQKIIQICPNKKMHIIAGKGNNGGDGLVIFRKLKKKI